MEYFIRLLRARRERPRGCRAAEHRYELPPSQVACHLPQPHWDRIGLNDITLEIVGLARRSGGRNAAIRLLYGEKRTFPEGDRNDANDPLATSAGISTLQ